MFKVELKQSCCEDLNECTLWCAVPLGGAAVFMNENVCRTDTEWKRACRRVRDQGSVNS